MGIPLGDDGKQMIVIHPGSGSLLKCCPPALLAQTLHHLMAVPRRTTLVCGGPADDKALQEFIPHLEGLCYEVLCDQDLRSVAKILSSAHVFIGHDSGLTHLAAALGVSTIALFGPTDPTRWGPKGSHVSIVRGRVCQCTGWDQVRSCQHRPCLDISIEQVVELAEQHLARLDPQQTEVSSYNGTMNMSNLALQNWLC